MRSQPLLSPAVTSCKGNAELSHENHTKKAPPMYRRQLLGNAALIGACKMLLEPVQQAKAYDSASIFNINATLKGQDFPFSQFENKVVCIVNVASE